MNTASGLLPTPKIITKLRGGPFSRSGARLTMFCGGVPAESAAALLSVADASLRRVERCAESARAGLQFQIDRQLVLPGKVRADVLDQAYVLEVSAGAIRAKARAPAGLFYALQTLIQLQRGVKAIAPVRITDWPDMPRRGIHLMFGYGSPSIGAVRDLVIALAAFKMNFMILEYDDRFPFQRHPKIASPLAFSSGDIRSLIALARERQVELVPLLDSLGHAQQYLVHPEYKHLAEWPGSTALMCPSNPKTLEFMQDLWSDVFELHTDCRAAHVTGDECFGAIRNKGFCAKCQPFHESGRTSELYCNYYGKLARWMLERGRRPIMWGDMLLAFPEQTSALPREVIIHDWHYWRMAGQERDAWKCTSHFGRGGTITPDNYARVPEDLKRRFGKYWLKPGKGIRFRPFPYVRYFQDQGFEVLGGPSASAEETILPVPPMEGRIHNAKYFARAIRDAGALGLANTFWSGSTTVEIAFPGIAAGGAYAWHYERESEQDFLKRLDAAWPVTPAGSLAAISAALNTVNVPQSGFVTGAAPVFPAAIRKAAVKLRKARSELRTFQAFERQLAENIELAAELGAMRKTLAEIDSAELVYPSADQPIDLRPALNVGLFDLTHLPGAGLSNMATGLQRPWKVAMRIAAHKDRAAIGLYGPEQPARPRQVSVPVNAAFDRLFFLHTCAYAYPGSTPFIYRIRRADNTSADYPVVVGRNISGWTARAPTPPFAVPGWQFPRYGAGGATVTAWLAWWDVPVPRQKISALDIIASGEKPGYGMIIAVTGRCGLPRTPSAPRLQAWQKRLDAHAAAIERCRAALESVYRNTMGAQDAAQAMSVVLRFDWADLLKGYRERINRMMNAAGRQK